MSCKRRNGSITILCWELRLGNTEMNLASDLANAPVSNSILKVNQVVRDKE
jgi:hypothetical protein